MGVSTHFGNKNSGATIRCKTDGLKVSTLFFEWNYVV